MNKITYPLNRGMQGPPVADLHNALQVLFERNLVLADDEPARSKLVAELSLELEQQSFGDATAELVRLFQAANHLERTGKVDAATAAALTELLPSLRLNEANGQARKAAPSVSGTVIDHLGRPREGVTVVLEKLRPGGPAEKLAETTTKQAGVYSASYNRASDGMNLRACVSTRSGAAYSTTLLNAPSIVENLDIVVTAKDFDDSTDFNRVDTALRRAAKRHKISSLTELTETPAQPDASLLAAETGIPVEKVILLIAARRIEKETDGHVSAELAYGLGSVGVPFGAVALLKMPREVLAAQVERAVKASTVSSNVRQDVDKALNHLNNASKKVALKAVIESPIGKIFDDAVGSNQAQAHRFFEIASADLQDSQSLWQKVSRDATLRPVASDLRFAAEATMLVGAQPKAVAMLRDLRKSGDIQDLSSLAKWTAADWEKQLSKAGIDAPGVAKDASDKARAAARRAYAIGMDRVIEASHSRLYARHRVAASTLPGSAAVAEFLDAAKDFSFTATMVPAYLRANPEIAAKLRSPEARSTVLKLSRVARAARRMEPAITLVADGLGSAHSIAAMGPKMFARKYSRQFGGEYLALEAHARARQATEMAAELIIQASPSMDSSLKVLPPSGVSALAAFPDWATLFGAEDGCACEHWRSVTSPGAYLVDVLQFLKRRVPPAGGPSALEVLRRPGRRLDIAEIEHTGDNTEIVLPYIDLVNEALEDCVAPLPPFAPAIFTGPVETEPNRSVISAALRNKINAALGLNNPAQADFAISADATLHSLTDGRPWTGASAAWRLEDPLATYTITTDVANYRIASRGRNTRGPSQLRLLSPQYINARAYRRLSEAYYPWSLPFNRALIEARVGLTQLERPLADVLEAFAPGDADSRRQRPEVLRERLGLSALDAQLVIWDTAAAPAVLDLDKPWLHFGFPAENAAIPDPADVTADIPAANWVTTISGRVDVFLNRTQLTIDDVLALLDTRYVNPIVAGQHVIELVSTDPSDPATCQTRKLSLRGLDRAALIRIARLVRLSMRSGLAYREIDDALLALNFNEPNANFLEALGLMVSLRDRLGADWTQLAAVFILATDARLNRFWAPNGPERNVNHGDGATELAPTLYEQLFRPAFNRSPGLRWFPADPGGLTGLDLKEGLAGLAAAFGISSTDAATLLGSTRVLLATGTGVDTTATLPNLSRLHRHALIVGRLGLAASEYLNALQLLNPDPFASPAALVSFLAAVQRAQESSLSMDELRWLTRRTSDLPDAARQAADRDFLTNVRSALNAVVADNRFVGLDANGEPPTSDRDGAITRRKLIAIGLPAALADAVVQALSESAAHEHTDAALGALGIDPATIELNSYQVTLAALPATVDLTTLAGGKVSFAGGQLRASGVLSGDEREGLHNASADVDYRAALVTLFELQDNLQGRAQFDPATGRLRFNGPMPTLWREHLLLLGPQGWQDAVDTVRNRPRDVAHRILRACKLTKVSTALATGLPVKLPPSMEGRLFFDASVNHLRLAGPLLPSEKDMLKNLAAENTPTNIAFAAALDALDLAAEAAPIASGARLMTAAEIDGLLDQPINAAERYRRVLQIVLPRAAKMLSEAALFQALAGSLAISAETAERLARFEITAPAGGRPACEVLCDPTFVQTPPAIVPDFPAARLQHEVLRLLQHAALLALRFNLLAADFKHLATVAGWPGLSSLPVQPLADGTATPLAATELLRFADYRTLRDRIPGGRDAVVEISTRAAAPGVTLAEMQALIADRLRRSTQEVAALCEPSVLNYNAAASFQDERGLLRMTLAFEELDRLGLGASTVVSLRASPLGAGAGRAVLDDIGGAMDSAQWQEVGRELYDKVRLAARDALLTYLLARGRPAENGIPAARWRTVGAIFGHLLIDVEMGPCMETSRLRQAMSSVQLFVQRCQLGLEPEIVADAAQDDGWLQWDVMRTYRVWEANVKVRLRPEDLLGEPAFMDIKSPLFRELEGDLGQGEVTIEVAARAALAYLQKLKQIANLKPVTTARQTMSAGEILHVVACQPGDPPTHYYRRRDYTKIWSPWEKVELEIQSEHVLLYVWNGRPFLFWLLLTPRAENPEMSGTTITSTDKVDVKLAWSEFRDGQWTPQRQSRNLISLEKWHVDYYGIVFRALRDEEDVLWLELKYPACQKCQQDLYSGETFRIDYPHAEPEVEVTKMPFFPDEVPNANHWLSGQRILRSDNTQYSFQLPYEIDAPADALKKSSRTIVLTYSSDETEQEFQKFPFLYRDRRRVFVVFPSARHVCPEISDFVLPDDFRIMFIDPDRFPPVEVIPDPIGPWPPPEPIDPLGPWINPVREALRVDGEIRAGVARGNPAFYCTQPVEEIAHVFARELSYAKNTSREAHAMVVRRNEAPGTLLGELGLGQLSGDPSMRPLNLRRSSGMSGKAVSIGGVRCSASMLQKSAASSLSGVISKEGMVKDPFIGRELRIYTFEPFYHPYVDGLIHVLQSRGIEAMLARDVQLRPHAYLPTVPVAPLHYRVNYDSNAAVVHWKQETETLDFDFDGAYSVYNWELFYHVPMLIADRLARSQRFDDARRWLHMIFDPRNQSTTALKADGTPVTLGSARYWQTKPLFFNSLPQSGVAADIDTVVERERIERILTVLATAAAPDANARLTPADREDLENFRNQIEESRRHPFRPYAIARLRTSAFQRAVVIKYIQIAVQQADQLYRRPTMESINAATQLYLMAADFRGATASVMPPRAVAAPQSYSTLEGRLDEGSNALVQIEAFVTPSAAPAISTTASAPPPAMLAFCIPPNEKLAQLWDLIALRLFNIHHCLNIDGAAMRLALFEPPIDPALLARAVAAGMDIGAALADLDGPTPTRRFRVVIRQAAELAAEVRTLGGALLSAWEKRDGEKVAQLRALHERSIAERAREVRALQVREADANRAALLASRDSALERFRHYRRLLGETNLTDPAVGARVPMRAPRTDTATHNSEVFKMFAKLLSQIPGGGQPPGTDLEGIPVNNYEDFELAMLVLSQSFQITSSIYETISGIANFVPNFNLQPYGLGATFGGSNVGSALSAVAAAYRGLGGAAGFVSTMAGRAAQFASRADDWTLQQNLAAREIMQIDRQIIAADLRRQIAQRELENHDLQLQDLATYEDTLKTKFTNQSLYDWVIGRLSDLHFQAYQLAYDRAKRAQRAARIELQMPQLDYIRFGQWDSLHKGLTAGDGLAMDIRRLELAYDEADTREDEMVMHFSLVRTNPSALVRLRETGVAAFSIPEALIDMQCAGQYLRRIRGVTVTLPCQTGPYTGVHCRLTLLRSMIRTSNALRGRQKTYARDDRNDDQRFTLLAAQVQSIVTSSGQNDSGQFEPSLQDPRYAPFEGLGCISEWRIEFTGLNRASLRNLDDVVLQMRFTARHGGEAFRAAAQAELAAALNALQTASAATGLVRRFSLRHEAPAAWQRFIEAPQGGFNSIELPIHRDRFPIFIDGRIVKIRSIQFIAKLRREDFSTLGNLLRGDLAPRSEAATTPLQLKPWLGTTSSGTWDGLIDVDRPSSATAPATWRLRLQRINPVQPIPAAALEDLELFVVYTIT